MNKILASEEHKCYYCGEDKNIILIPVCKDCLDSFNKFIEKEFEKEHVNGGI